MSRAAESCLHGLWLFVGAYVGVLAVAGLILSTSRDDGRDGADGPRQYILDADGVSWPYPPDLLNCSSLQEVTDLEFVAAGWTKAVYRGRLRGRGVAIKTVNLNGQDIRSCQDQPATLASCYRRAAAKVLRELALLHELRHPNVVEVFGACVPSSPGPVAVVTELGDPLDSVRLLQLSWEDRLRLALGVARILHRLARSPLGSLAMNDFRRQQFVLVGGSLKLSDVDDVGVSEPRCGTDSDCGAMLTNSTTPALAAGLTCTSGRCRGYNERLNIWRAGRHFIRLFLPAAAPSSLEPLIRDLLAAYAVDEPTSDGEGAAPLQSGVPANRSSAKLRSQGPWDSGRILELTQRLVASSMAGEAVVTARSPAQFDRDYHCESETHIDSSRANVGSFREWF